MIIRVILINTNNNININRVLMAYVRPRLGESANVNAFTQKSGLKGLGKL